MSQRPSGTEIARGRRGTLNTMRIRQGAVLGVAMLACVWVASWGAPAPKKKKSRRPPAPTVSAAARNAALRRVDGYLEASAESPFAQPAALVPFFEQLVRAKSGEEKASPEARAGVHIIQWGDSRSEASAESPFAQPAALVPFFEQLVRAKSGEEKASPEARAGVHIIQWGDS